MNTIAAREIKRRGMAAVDAALDDGPVHIIKNDKLTYVVLTEDYYRELVDGYEEWFLAGVKESLEDARVGRVRKVTAEQLINGLGPES
jgi:PHD/YefM family antitoxin component YafN of YafNO toxin-antitoxin module